MSHKIHALIGFILLLFTSCKDCEPVPSSLYSIEVQMYDYDSLLLSNKRVAYTDTFSSIRAVGLDLPIAEDAASGSWSLPLSNQADSVIFVWEDRLGSRELTVSYRKKGVPVPPDCGIYEVYEGIELSGHDFDSALVVKPVVELGDRLHLEIFARKP